MGKACSGLLEGKKKGKENGKERRKKTKRKKERRRGRGARGGCIGVGAGTVVCWAGVQLVYQLLNFAGLAASLLVLRKRAAWTPGTDTAPAGENGAVPEGVSPTALPYPDAMSPIDFQGDANEEPGFLSGAPNPDGRLAEEESDDDDGEEEDGAVALVSEEAQASLIPRAETGTVAVAGAHPTSAELVAMVQGASSLRNMAFTIYEAFAVAFAIILTLWLLSGDARTGIFVQVGAARGCSEWAP